MISFATKTSTNVKSNPALIKHGQGRVIVRKAGLRAQEYKISTTRKRPPLTKKALARLWYKNIKIDLIAEFFGVSDEKIRTAVKEYELNPKQVVQETYDSEWQPGDPTPEEIKQRAAWIRESWTENERLHRMGMRVEQAAWTPPAFTYNTKRAMFVGA